MRPPALIFAWLLWRRHRRGLTASLAGVLGLSLCYRVLPPGTEAQFIGELDLVVLSMASLYAVAVFSFGFEADVAARASGFPARLFTLPVRTAVLVRWPLLYGTAAIVLAWVGVGWFVLRHQRPDAPVWLQALAWAAVLACLQAVVWWPFPLPWARVVVAVLVLAGFVAVVPVAHEYELTAGQLTALFAGLIVAAYPVAYLGVRRARRGEGQGWPALTRLAGRVREALPGRRAPFPSAARAQAWLEWRGRGMLVPFFVGANAALLLPCVPAIEGFLNLVTDAGLAPGYAGLSAAAGNSLAVLAGILLIPPFWGTLLGGSLGLSATKPHYTLPAFLATRPLSDGALAAAKFRLAGRSALAAWAVLAVLLLAWLALPGHAAHLAEFRRTRLAGWSALEIVALAAGVLAGLVALTWVQLIKGLAYGLTGRWWIFCVRSGLAVLVVFLVGFGANLAYRDFTFREAMADLFPKLAVAWAVAKVVTAALVLGALVRLRLARVRTVTVLAALWLLAVAGSFALLNRFVPEGSVPVFWLALGPVLFLPLARPAAAPLALAWNRHR